MGIINQGILGGFSGKVGPIVGFRWKSNYYIRARAAKVSNPRTPKQQEQRGKFATAFSFLKAIKPCFCSADGNTIANSIRLSVSVIDTPENEIEILTEPIPKNYKKPTSIKKKGTQIQIKQNSSYAPPQGHSDTEVQATTIDRYFTPGSAALIPCTLRANILSTKS